MSHAYPWTLESLTAGLAKLNAKYGEPTIEHSPDGRTWAYTWPPLPGLPPHRRAFETAPPTFRELDAWPFAQRPPAPVTPLEDRVALTCPNAACPNYNGPLSDCQCPTLADHLGADLPDHKAAAPPAASGTPEPTHPLRARANGGEAAAPIPREGGSSPSSPLSLNRGAPGEDASTSSGATAPLCSLASPEGDPVAELARKLGTIPEKLHLLEERRPGVLSALEATSQRLSRELCEARSWHEADATGKACATCKHPLEGLKPVDAGARLATQDLPLPIWDRVDADPPAPEEGSQLRPPEHDPAPCNRFESYDGPDTSPGASSTPECMTCGWDETEHTAGESGEGEPAPGPDAPAAGEPPIADADQRDFCHWHPAENRPARPGDPWHAAAEFVAGPNSKEPRRLCEPCSVNPDALGRRRKVVRLFPEGL